MDEVAHRGFLVRGIGDDFRRARAVFGVTRKAENIGEQLAVMGRESDESLLNSASVRIPGERIPLRWVLFRVAALDCFHQGAVQCLARLHNFLGKANAASGSGAKHEPPSATLLDAHVKNRLAGVAADGVEVRSEEHTSELQS